MEGYPGDNQGTSQTSTLKGNKVSAHYSAPDRGKWYFLVTILTCGLFAWVPLLHAGSHLKDSGLKRLAAIHGAAAAVSMALISIAPENSEGESTGPMATVGAIIALGIMISACVKLSTVRRQVYPFAPVHGQYFQPQTPAVDPSVQNALAAREHRDKARKIVQSDPALARDLRIGRPDLEREFYDGGLVDLNNAPASILSHYCGIPPEAAERIVTTRALYAEGFSSVEEAIVVSDQTFTAAGFLRDRGVVLPR